LPTSLSLHYIHKTSDILPRRPAAVIRYGSLFCFSTQFRKPRRGLFGELFLLRKRLFPLVRSAGHGVRALNSIEEAGTTQEFAAPFLRFSGAVSVSRCATHTSDLDFYRGFTVTSWHRSAASGSKTRGPALLFGHFLRWPPFKVAPLGVQIN